MTDLEARKKADLEAFRKVRAAQLRAIEMGNTTPAMKEWPLKEPLQMDRTAEFLWRYERAYRNGMPTRFMGTGQAADQRVNTLLEEVRAAIGGDPIWWNGYFTKLRGSCLRNVCRELDTEVNDLPWWLRGIQPGSEQKNRFQIIFEWV